MLAIKTILHPTDFSEPSTRALRLACGLADDYNARVVVLHAAPQPPTTGYAPEIAPPDPESLRHAAWERLEGLDLPATCADIERRFTEGDPASEIVRIARAIDADLIVMGVHEGAGLRGWLINSVTAERVTAEAPCPVLTASDRSRALRANEPVQSAEPASPRTSPAQSSDVVVQEASEDSFPASDPPAWIHQPRAGAS